MSIEVKTAQSVEELRNGINVISHYFGNENTTEDAERFAQWIEVDRMHVAWEDGTIVGGAGALTYRMSVPGGGWVNAAGTTVVGVLPTHRRRGVLRAMMNAQLDDSRTRGDAVAYLWASEGTIYPRFGFGLASRMGEVTLARERTAFAQPFEPRGTVRIVDLEEAARTFPPLYEQVFAQRPGMFARNKAWWETRRLFDNPERRRGGPLHRALLELDGQPAGYALYRVAQDWVAGSSSGTITVQEVITPTRDAARELWRWMLDFDWTSRFTVNLLPLDHELFLLLAEPRRLNFQINDGVWVRILDVPAALSGRTFAGDGEIVLELADSLFPENAGRWRVSAAGIERTDAAADIRADITALGSVYLGGFTFANLVRSFRADELTDGAAVRADALFATGIEPWCPEIF
jgi:predicted acetyltransferase